MEERIKVTINLNDSNYKLLDKPKQIENLLYNYYNKHKNFDLIKDLNFDLKGYENFDFDFKNNTRMTINQKLWLLLKKYIRDIDSCQKSKQYQSDIYINVLLYNFFKQPYEIDASTKIVDKINLEKIKQKGEQPFYENMSLDEQEQNLDWAFDIEQKEKFEFFITSQNYLSTIYGVIISRLNKLKILEDKTNGDFYQRMEKQRFGLTFKATIDIYKIYLDNKKLKTYNPRYRTRIYWQ